MNLMGQDSSFQRISEINYLFNLTKPLFSCHLNFNVTTAAAIEKIATIQKRTAILLS